MIKVQQKLKDFEVEPPELLWGKISTALDAGQTLPHEKRLYQLELSPPAVNWDRISQALDRQKIAVTPSIKGRRYLYRYLSAAAVLIIIIVSASKYLNRATPAVEIASPLEIPAQKNEIFVPAIKLPQEKQTTEYESPTVAMKAASASETNKRRVASKMPLLKIERSSSFAGNLLNQKHSATFKSDLLERYIVFSKQSGETVRLPRKWFSFFNCADYAEDCKQKIKTAQQQIAAPDLMAATDFTGVLDLLQTMKAQ